MIPRYTHALATACVSFLLLCLPFAAHAQCRLRTIGDFTLNLVYPAERVLTLADLTTSTNTCTEGVVIELFENQFLPPRTDLTIRASDVGKTLTAAITVPTTGACDHIRIRIVDRLGPIITADPMVMLNCNDDISDEALAATFTAVDNVTPTTRLRFSINRFVESNGCADGVARRIRRVIYAYDESGNISNPVEQIIVVKRIPLNQVDVPESYTVLASDLVDGVCPNDSPAEIPVVQPTFNGKPLAGLCKLIVSTSDMEFQSDGCVRKIMRTHQILDCCTFESRSAVQFITYIDDVAPKVTVDTALIAVAGQPNDADDCLYQVTLPPAAISDACNDVNSTAVRIEFDAAIPAIQGNGGTATNIPVRPEPYSATYVVTDVCGNETRETVTFRTIDPLGPTLICTIDPINVTLSGTTTEITAGAFDFRVVNNNCCPADIALRVESSATFTDELSFTCEDVGTLSVTLRATDCFGLVDSCTYTVNINDNMGGTISDAEPLVLSCADLDASGNPPAATDANSPVVMNSGCDNFILESVVTEPLLEGPCGTGEFLRTFTFVDGDAVVTKRQDLTVIFDDTPLDLPTFPTEPTPVDCGTVLNPDQFPASPVANACATYTPVVTVAPTSGPCNTEATVTYTFIPDCADLSPIVVTQQLVFTDTEAPTFSEASTDIFVDYDCQEAIEPIIPSFKITDNCDSSPLLIPVDGDVEQRPNGDDCASRVEEFRFAAIDGCGNLSTETRSIFLRVTDVDPPIIGATLNDVDLGLCLPDEGLPAALTLAELMVTDGCSEVTADPIISETTLSQSSCSGSILRTYTVADACGNSASISQTFTYGAPGPFTVSVEARAAGLSYECPNAVPTASADQLVITNEGCAGFEVTNITDDFTANDEADCSGTVTRTYAVVDNCSPDETIEVTETFVIRDETGPVISPLLPSDQSFTCFDDILSFTELPNIAEVTTDCSNGIGTSQS